MHHVVLGHGGSDGLHKGFVATPPPVEQDHKLGIVLAVVVEDEPFELLLALIPPPGGLPRQRGEVGAILINNLGTDLIEALEMSMEAERNSDLIGLIRIVHLDRPGRTRQVRFSRLRFTRSRPIA